MQTWKVVGWHIANKTNIPDIDFLILGEESKIQETITYLCLYSEEVTYEAILQ